MIAGSAVLTDAFATAWHASITAAQFGPDGGRSADPRALVVGIHKQREGQLPSALTNSRTRDTHNISNHDRSQGSEQDEPMPLMLEGRRNLANCPFGEV
jgi:hypothetical protein